MRKIVLIFMSLFIALNVFAGAADISLPKTHVSNKTIKAADVNANEQHIQSVVNSNNPDGDVVGTTDTQTLSGKTLTSPTITTSPTAAGATWTDLGAVTTVDINGGTIDGATIGATSATTAVVTTLNTGQGANELYDMDQNVLTTSNVSFSTATVDQLILGATEKLSFDGGGAGGNTYVSENTADNITVVAGGVSALGIKATGIGIPATAPLYFDGSGMSGDTYIHEASANNLYLVASAVSCLYMNGTNLFSPIVYSATTASAADVNVAASGLLARVTSARKYKTNERPLLFDKTKLMGLQAIIYNSKCTNDNPETDYIGIVADDAMKYYPELITYNDKGEPENFQYSRLTAVLLKALQTQQLELDDLTKRVEKLEKKVGGN